jgi:hypothetical protein
MAYTWMEGKAKGAQKKQLDAFHTNQPQEYISSHILKTKAFGSDHKPLKAPLAAKPSWSATHLRIPCNVMP